MTPTFDPALDLSVSRIMRVPKETLWNAWADPALFEQWWIQHLSAVRFARWISSREGHSSRR